MFGDTRVAVVIPAYDESRHIEGTIRGVPTWVDRIVVIDDGSHDRTAAIARACGDHRCVVVQHDSNHGVGAAIATGYKLAFGDGADVAVVMAGDGQMDPDDLPALVGPVSTGLADYAKGDRFSWPNARRAMPFTRWLGGHAFSWLTRIITGLSIRDSQCGYTALSRRAAERLDLDALWHGYGYPNDLLGRAAEAGLLVRDVRVRPIYADEKSGLGLRHVFFVLPRVMVAMWWRRRAHRHAPPRTGQPAPQRAR
jgi:glycosyltransferase involved in cell wall biosynthesis